MELISREDAIKALEEVTCDVCEHRSTWCALCDKAEVLIRIHSLPTIEEREEGKWKDYKRLIMTDPKIWGYSQECSLCGFVLGAKEYNFCPNCGAKIIGE